MRHKEGFVLRKISDEQIVVGEGPDEVDFNRIICLNETAAYLWTNCVGVDFDTDYLSGKLVEAYHVSSNVALLDAQQMINKWLEAGLLDFRSHVKLQKNKNFKK